MPRHPDTDEPAGRLHPVKGPHEGHAFSIGAPCQAGRSPSIDDIERGCGLAAELVVILRAGDDNAVAVDDGDYSVALPPPPPQRLGEQVETEVSAQRKPDAGGFAYRHAIDDEVLLDPRAEEHIG